MTRLGGWRCRFCGGESTRGTMAARRIHEHRCPQRPEVIASRAAEAERIGRSFDALARALASRQGTPRRVGDVVAVWFDTGALGARLLYGRVIAAGPKVYRVRWESGRTNRVAQDRREVWLVEAPADLDAARVALARAFAAPALPADVRAAVVDIVADALVADLRARPPSA